MVWWAIKKKEKTRNKKEGKRKKKVQVTLTLDHRKESEARSVKWSGAKKNYLQMII